MSRFFHSYASVPELRPLSREERIRVLRMSGAAYGRRRRVWQMWLLSLAAPTAVALIAYLALQDVGWSLGIGGIAMPIGYSIWFHMRLTQLRPFVRQVLDGTITDEPPLHRVERWQDNPRYAISQGLFFGVFTGVAMWMTGNLPWWVVLALAFGMGLFFGTWMWFWNKHLKGR